MNPDKANWIDRLAASAPTGECVDWPWSVDSSGYARVWGPDQRVERVSQIMLERAGRPRPPAPGNHALHSCDRPVCVAPWHLRWGTTGENQAEAYERGLRRPAGVALLRGEQVGHARLTEAQVREIRQAYAAGGVTQQQLADQYGIAQVNIGKIIRRVTWRHVQ